MSTSAEVADLEDVFAKASIPSQTTQSNSQENTVIKKSSTIVLSEFQNTVRAPPEESKKADEVNAPSVLSGSVEISEEIQEVLIESTLTAENTVLVPVVETTKTIQETTSTTVTGSVELAEEIMEAFANSKTVLDTENPVSNDPSTLQEALDRLEQLAVERVREIEGELVNSTKQITECNLSLDVPNEPKASEVNENAPKKFESEMVVPNATDTSAKEVGESLCDAVVATVDLTSPSELISVVPEIRSADVGEKGLKSSSEIALLESAREKERDVSIAGNSKLMDTNTLEGEKTAALELEGKSDDTISEAKDEIENTVAKVEGESDDAVSKLEGKANYSVSELKAEVDTDVSKLVEKTDNTVCDVGSKTDLLEKKIANGCLKGSKLTEDSGIARTEGENNEFVEGIVKSSSSADVKVVQVFQENSGTSKVDPTKSVNPNKKILETAEPISAAQVVDDGNNGKKIKDIQNYETEDDDLEVLEAFIVKTATNPELAVCTVQPSKDNNALKYSLESSLLDDLTKTDNGSGANEGENQCNLVNKDSSLGESSGGDTAHLVQEKVSEKITSRLDSSDTNSKTGKSTIGQRSGKHENSVSSDRKLVEKKCHTQTSDDAVASSSSSAAKRSNEKAEKKVVFMEVKRRSVRSLISGKKASLSGESSALSRKETSIERAASEKSVSEKGVDEEKTEKADQNAVKRSIRNSKKMTIHEESVPSTSGIVRGQQITEHSSTQSEFSKIQKKHEQNIDSPASTSRSMLKINENKGEDRPTTGVKMVESPIKEKKKPKYMKSNNEEKSTSCTGLETVKNKRNVESDSTSKSNKKEERRLKENVETPINRNIKVGSNNSDVTKSRSTRSAKKIVTVKSPQKETNLSEYTKEKEKENVEKSTHPVVGGEDVKRQTERTTHKETPTLKCDKNDKGLQKKKTRSLSEGAKDTKKKNDENLQVSTAVKYVRGGRDIEGLPNTRASTSTHSRAEKDPDRGSLTPKVSSDSLTQKGAEEGNVPDSGTVVKRKRVEKEIEDSLSDGQLSPTTVKRKRGETEVKESLSEIKISPKSLKRKKPDIEIKPSSHTVKGSPTTLKHKRVEREFEQSMLNAGIEFSPVTHSDSNSIRRNLPRVPSVYSDSMFVEFEDITFEMLRSKAKQLVLPTLLWGAQVSMEKDLVAFSRLRADLSDDKPMIDKALVFQGSLKPIALINNESVDLPIPCVRTFEDVVMLIRNFHTVSFCEGTGVKQRPQSKYCFRYLDVANPGGRCSQCLEERRRVLFGCARKLRERINVMKAAKSRQ